MFSCWAPPVEIQELWRKFSFGDTGFGVTPSLRRFWNHLGLHILSICESQVRNILWGSKTWNHRDFRTLDASMCLLGALESTEAEVCKGAPSILWKICWFTYDLDRTIHCFPQAPFQNASRNRTPRNICGMQAWSWRTSKTRGLGQIINAKTLNA